LTIGPDFGQLQTLGEESRVFDRCPRLNEPQAAFGPASVGVFTILSAARPMSSWALIDAIDDRRRRAGTRLCDFQFVWESLARNWAGKRTV
jgi:hypothetical protein